MSDWIEESAAPASSTQHRGQAHPPHSCHRCEHLHAIPTGGFIANVLSISDSGHGIIAITLRSISCGASYGHDSTDSVMGTVRALLMAGWTVRIINNRGVLGPAGS